MRDAPTVTATVNIGGIVLPPANVEAVQAIEDKGCLAHLSNGSVVHIPMPAKDVCAAIGWDFPDAG